MKLNMYKAINMLRGIYFRINVNLAPDLSGHNRDPTDTVTL